MFSNTTTLPTLQIQTKYTHFLSPPKNMMIGETRRHHHIGPPWPEPTSPTMSETTPPASPSATSYAAVLASLRHYVLSAADQKLSAAGEVSTNSPEIDFPAEDDDEFFMYEFKIRKCTRARAHDWTECPFAHPGEKARRRDPRKYTYSGTACSDFRKGGCKKGDACEFAHGVFECWLHPARYRTQACKDGPGCRRRVCFFAHTGDQVRAGSGSPRSPHSNVTDYDFADDGLMSSSFGSSSIGSGSIGSGSIAELALSLRNLQLNKVKSMPNSWAGGGIQIGSPVFGSPRAGPGSPGMGRAGFFSLPTTPTQPWNGMWDKKEVGEEEPVMERVESGRELRARMFEKLSKENPLNGPVRAAEISIPGPDFGWVSDLVT